MKRKKWFSSLSLLLVFGMVLTSSPVYADAMGSIRVVEESSSFSSTDRSTDTTDTIAETETLPITEPVTESETESEKETILVTEAPVETEPRVTETETKATEPETETIVATEAPVETETAATEVEAKATEMEPQTEKKKKVKLTYDFSSIKDFSSLMDYVYQYQDGDFYTWMSTMEEDDYEAFKKLVDKYDQEDSVMGRYAYIKGEIEKLTPSKKSRSANSTQRGVDRFLGENVSNYASVSTGSALRNALESTKDQGIINLTTDVNFSKQVTVNNTCTIRGATFSTTCSSQYLWFMEIAQGNTVTLDTTLLNQGVDIGGINILNGGTLVLSAKGTIANFKMKHSGAGVYVSKGGTFNIYGLIDSCIAGMMGGGVYSYGTVNMYTGARIVNSHAECDNGVLNEALGGGGGGISTQGKFTMYGGSIENCTSVYLGGGVRNNGIMKLSGGSIHHNVAQKNGGGVYSGTEKDSQFIMTGGEIYANAAVGVAGDDDNSGGDGGGLKILGVNANGGGNVLSGGKIYNNESARGGGIYSRGDTTLSGVEIYGNQANNGGGVYTYANTLTISGSTIRNNTAAFGGQGGGIYAKAPVVMTSGTIKNNSAEGSAGGILVGGYSVTNEFNDIGSFNMSGGSIFGNTTGGVGAGIYQVGEGEKGLKPSVTFSGGSVYGNTGGGGYGIYNNSLVGTVSLLNGASMGFTAWDSDTAPIFNSNANGNIYNKGILSIKATDTGYVKLASGGGTNIYNTSTGTTSIYSEGNLKHYAVINSKGGTGILNEGTLAMSEGRILMAANGIINKGRATISGGKLYLNTSHAIYNSGASATLGLTNTEIFNNTSTGNGAGVANDSGTVTMSSGEIHNNSAANGGGVYNGKVGTVGGTFNLNGGSIYSNSTTSGGGGGVANGDGATVRLAGTDIYLNTSKGSGGGVYNVGTGYMTAGRVRLNTSPNGGGVQNSGMFTMSGGTVGGVDASNKPQGNTSANNGGGIRNDKTLVFSGGTISHNSAVYNGGGIFSGTNNSVAITGGTIDSNKVTAGNGGGITVAPNTSTLVIKGCTITNNSAVNGDNGYGGGLYSDAATELSLNNISSNSAGYGGGVFMNGADCSLNSGSVNGNTSTKHGGGGVYINYNTLYVNGGTINGNTAETAGGGAAAFGGFIEVNGGSITNNSAKTNGGGLYAEDGGTVDHPESKITFLKGAIKGNAATMNGGGICTKKLATAEINTASGDSAELSLNTAGQGGGGIYADKALKLTNCLIKNNAAVDGAGIYGASASTITLTSGDINDNTATGKGGGAFVGGSMQAAGGLNKNNANEGGGLYISSKGNADISGCNVKSNAAVSGAGAFNGGTLAFGENTLLELNKASANGGAVYNNGTITMGKGMIGANAAIKGKSIYQNGALNVSENPVIQEEIFLTPDHFITITKSGCTTDFITAMDEVDTFDGRVLANYRNADSGQISKYSLETATKGYAGTKGIDIVDKVPASGAYPYQVLLEGNKVLIEYNGNPARGDESKLKGSVQSDIVPISEMYTLRDNGYTYERHSYTGWSKYTYDSGKMFQPGNQIIPESSLNDAMNPISRLNKFRMKTKNQVSVRSLVEAYGEPVVDEDMDGVKYKVDLYAIWDEAPTIGTVAIEFYEGEKVLGKQLKDGLYFSKFGAQDKEDGKTQHGKEDFPHLLDDKTSIRKVTYNPLQNGYVPNPVSIDFITDVPADTFYLDTYSGKGMVKDEVVINKLTFHVEDSRGNVTEEDGDVRINYNNFPTLKVPENLILTTEHLRAHPLTQSDLLKYAKANDVEDDAARLQGIIYEGNHVNIQNKVIIVSVTDKNGTDIQPEFIHDIGDYFVNYSVTDRFGKETLKTMKLTSIEPALLTAEDIKYVRFISLKYLDTLDENSKWDKEELKAILQNETPQKTYKFTHEQVLEIKELMKGLRSKADFEGVIQDIIRSYF